MKIYLDITIGNDIGEMLDKRYWFESTDELRKFLWESVNIDKMVDEAEKNGKDDGILDTTEGKVEYDETPEYDGSSREDLINSDEKFN